MKEGELILTGLHPLQEYQTDSPNDTSIVIMLEYRRFTMLLTGDMEEEAERRLLSEKELKDIDVLQVAHHGSKSSSCDDILDTIKPEYALISCGKKNQYGHPHDELLGRLIDRNCSFYVTTDSGQITIQTDGSSMRIIPYLNLPIP